MKIECPNCYGTGKMPGRDFGYFVRCESCEGTGRMTPMVISSQARDAERYRWLKRNNPMEVFGWYRDEHGSDWGYSELDALIDKELAKETRNASPSGDECE